MKLLRPLLCALALASLLPAQTVLVQPYVQPAESTATGERDTKLIVWFTDQRPAAFIVDYGTNANFGSTAQVARVTLNVTPEQRFFKYIATLPDLPLDSEAHYRVRIRGGLIRAGSFSTRKSPASPLRFVVVGDAADGSTNSQQIAYQIGRTKPDSMVIVGDIAYLDGRVTDYFSSFWGVYNNVLAAAPTNGSPLMQSVPVHAVLGNHDITGRFLDLTPDGLAAFYFFHAPTNGPRLSEPIVPPVASREREQAFKAAAGPAHPALAFYSFDNGPAHFLCLDANYPTNIVDAALHQWMERDLTNSRAPWKLVFFHHAPFPSSLMHYNVQWMRLLSPLFEKCGVDVVFSGHVHNYQRSKPLKFAPAAGGWDARWMVAGRFTLDEKFDGRERTEPDGIVYIVTGGGGAGLYDNDMPRYPEDWRRAFNWAPFTARSIADRHSFSLVEVDTRQLTLRQVDATGQEVDRFQITKRK